MLGKTYSKQTFNIVDPLTMEVVEKKSRLKAHSEGSWHLALTAFICRKNTLTGNLEVLVQERSDYVDIAQKHYDQSLATQLLTIDNNDIDVALERGLFEELAIKDIDIKTKFLWNDWGNIYIEKRYSDNPDLWNRELVANYLVVLNDGVQIKGNFKVQSYKWLPWEELCNLVVSQPNRFTKTIRIFCVADSISDYLFEAMGKLIEGKNPKKYSDLIHYLSYESFDVVAYKRGVAYEMEVFKTNYSMRILKSLSAGRNYDILKKIIFSKEKSNGLIRLLSTMEVEF